MIFGYLKWSFYSSSKTKLWVANRVSTMSNFDLLNCEKQFNLIFLNLNTKGSIEKMSNFQSSTDLPTPKLTIKNMSNFDLVDTLIIQVK